MMRSTPNYYALALKTFSILSVLLVVSVLATIANDTSAITGRQTAPSYGSPTGTAPTTGSGNIPTAVLSNKCDEYDKGKKKETPSWTMAVEAENSLAEIMNGFNLTITGFREGVTIPIDGGNSETTMCFDGTYKLRPNSSIEPFKCLHIETDDASPMYGSPNEPPGNFWTGTTGSGSSGGTTGSPKSPGNTTPRSVPANTEPGYGTPSTAPVGPNPTGSGTGGGGTPNPLSKITEYYCDYGNHIHGIKLTDKYAASKYVPCSYNRLLPSIYLNGGGHIYANPFGNGTIFPYDSDSTYDGPLNPPIVIQYNQGQSVANTNLPYTVQPLPPGASQFYINADYVSH